MEINTKKWTRVIPCFLTVALVLLVSVVPAFAQDWTFYNKWTFNDDLDTPTWTSVNISFSSNGTEYTTMTYESFNEAYQVPVIKFGSNVAIFWRDGTSHFMREAFQFIDFGGFGTTQSSPFTEWFLANAKVGTITPESEQAGQIKDNIDDAAGRLEDSNNIFESLPEPTLSGHEFDFLIGQYPEYQQFMNFWQVCWNNSTMYEIILVLGGLMLASYLIFAGK